MKSLFTLFGRQAFLLIYLNFVHHLLFCPRSYDNMKKGYNLVVRKGVSGSDSISGN